MVKEIHKWLDEIRYKWLVIFENNEEKKSADRQRPTKPKVSDGKFLSKPNRKVRKNTRKRNRVRSNSKSKVDWYT